MTTVDIKRPKRLLALDVLRGITVAGMILVNNPGSWGNVYAPLKHASWNGLTPTDLVFPFFMFIMGLSTYMSLKKYDFRFSWTVVSKILRRTVLLFLIGMFVTWLSMFLRGVCNGAEFWESMMTFGDIRILGVIPRLALSYGIGALLAVSFRPKALAWSVALMLVVYALLLLFGNGYEFSERNIIAVIDKAVLGEAHMYTDHVDGQYLKFDPEGLLSTLPSVAHMLIGFLCGGLIMSTKDDRIRINRLFIVGTILTFAGFLLNYGLPINKKVWSPTFVLTTCGLASSFLALLIWIIDMKGYRKWSRFFVTFGVNPLFLYCASAVIAVLVGLLRIPCASAENGYVTCKIIIYQFCLDILSFGNEALASLWYSLIFVFILWALGEILYRKRIYIKI